MGDDDALARRVEGYRPCAAYREEMGKGKKNEEGGHVESKE